MYAFESRIRYSETDSGGKLSPEGLLNYFQDCSTFHSEDLGLGVNYLKEQSMAWVLSSWQISVSRYPELGEKVTVGTFPYEFKGYFGYRNFCMKDENGTYLARANSLWTLLDIRSMYPTKPTPLMLERYVLEEKLDMEYASRKITLPRDGRAEAAVKVHARHLDTNHHVNNVQFVRIAMDCLPDGFQISQLRAEYKKQAFLHEVLYPVVAAEDGGFAVSLQDADGGIYVNVEFQESGKEKECLG